VAVVVAVLGLGGFAVSQALGDATLFFRNADEAVAQRTELGLERFRLQGLVVAGSVVEDPAAELVAFEVSWNGVVVPVEHRGDPPELFQDDIPVVLEGHWAHVGDDAPFLSDRMLVKHDENYEEENSDRLAEAEDGTDGGREGDGGP
jgi:cytochrome c-type biogenesis protein CcmE